MIGPTLAVSLAAVAAASLTVSASAETYWEKGGNSTKERVAFDNAYYGGLLPVGFDENADAVRVLIKAANAVGQLRGNQYGGSTYLVVGDTSAAMRISAEGTWNGKPADVVFDYTYRVPGVRLDVTYEDGTREITVAAMDMAWDEETPGMFGGEAQTSANERLIWSYLMPSGVVVLGRDAALVIEASKDERARDVLTIPVPSLGDDVNLVATLDARGRPIHTLIEYDGHTYRGDFDTFLADRNENLVYSPHHIVFSVDGTEVADLEANWHQTNPYLIFVVPTEVAPNQPDWDGNPLIISSGAAFN
jgi:hypothetical protein